MRSRFYIIASLTTIGLAAGTTGAVAAEPTTASLLGFLKPSPAEPQGQNLELKAEHGPWLIYAASLEGPDAKMQAVQLAAELREEFDLTAYILPKTLDFSNRVVGSGFNAQGGEKIMRFADDRVVESFTILIGDYTSLDAPETREALRRIKSIKPKFYQEVALAASADEVTSGEKVMAYRAWLKWNRKEEAANEDGPMSNAFITRNPLLPEEFYDAPEMDRFITELNKKAEHSILNCKGRFTVRVANFRGSQTTLVGGTISGQEVADTDPASPLEEAAISAHQLASHLRRAGYEAYEYHDRESSSVCVGGFESLGAIDASGEFIYSPEITKLIAEFGGANGVRESQYGLVPVAKTLLDVVGVEKFPELAKGTEKERLAKIREYALPFDAIPKPIFVPRPSTNNLYGSSLLGLK